MRKFHTPASPIDSHLMVTSQEDVPEPRTLTYVTSAGGKLRLTPESKKKVDPTRYGDWEKNGRCIDF